jgi:hypothetical protein
MCPLVSTCVVTYSKNKVFVSNICYARFKFLKDLIIERAHDGKDYIVIKKNDPLWTEEIKNELTNEGFTIHLSAQGDVEINWRKALKERELKEIQLLMKRD